MFPPSSQTSFKTNKTNIDDKDKDNAISYNIICTDNPLTIVLPNDNLFARKPNSQKYLDILDFNTNIVSIVPVDMTSVSNSENLLINSLNQFIKLNLLDDTNKIFNHEGKTTSVCELAQLNRVSQQALIVDDNFYIFSVCGYKIVQSQQDNVYLGDSTLTQIKIEFTDDDDNIFSFKKPYNLKIKIYDYSNF